MSIFLIYESLFFCKLSIFNLHLFSFCLSVYSQEFYVFSIITQDPYHPPPHPYQLILKCDNGIILRKVRPPNYSQT
jgi:hypothetical protein